MKTYKQLNDEFNKKVEELQENCEHKELTPWMESQWAIGHSSTTHIRKCVVCNKTIAKDYIVKRCKVCQKSHPIYINLCDSCNSEEFEIVNIIKERGKII